MIKILYDILPFGLDEKNKKIITDNGFVSVAICASENIIVTGLGKTISSLLKDYKLAAWVKSDEKVALQLQEHVGMECYYKEMKPVGLLKYTLPEVAFVLTEKNIPYLLENFNQFSSLEIYALHNVVSVDKFLLQLKSHPARVDCKNILTYLKYSELIINKSGDEDELELTLKTKNAKKVLNSFFVQ